VVVRYFKHQLSRCGSLNEIHTFAPGQSLSIVNVDGVDVALAVGQDVGGSSAPLAAARAGAGLILHLSGSPFFDGQPAEYQAELSRSAREARVPIASANLVGGQDEVVFAGGSIVVATDGQPVARAGTFTEELLLVEVDAASVGCSRTVGGHGVSGVRDVPLGGQERIEPVLSGLGGPSSPVLVREGRGDAATTLAHDTRADLIGEYRADLASASTPRPPRAQPCSLPEVWNALILGTHDYTRKNGFDSAVVALSGGIDSAVVAVIASDALRPANVTAISMPSSCSSAHSRSDAAELGKRLGLDFRVVPIQSMVDSTLGAVPVDGIALENIQARIRGLILMAVSNQEGHLALNTGNKTEYGLGHNTLYGDQVGGYAPLKDVPKSLVWQLARWRNTLAEERGEIPPIPLNIITKEPSPELQAGQLDSQLLPAPYEMLDAVLAGYVDAELGREDLIAIGLDATVVDQVIEMVERGEFKRHQAPPGPRISARSFGRDRRVPITNRFVAHGNSAAFFPAGMPL
jgi:NAD+ synthase (glutamine-hydrolysing)